MSTTQSPANLPRTRLARTYLRTSQAAERRGATKHRQELLAGLRGRVVELGAGYGLNSPTTHPQSQK